MPVMYYFYFTLIAVFLQKSIVVYANSSPKLCNTTSVITRSEWKIREIHPIEAVIDTYIELEVVLSQIIEGPDVWCFVRTSDNETEVLPTKITENKVICSSIQVATSGYYSVGINSLKSDTWREEGAELKVFGKRPVAELAKYSFDFQRLSVYFNQNIQILDCNEVFTSKTKAFLGIGFGCSANGNILVVKLGVGPRELESLEIKGSVFGVGCVELSPPMSSAMVPVEPKKILRPSLSLHREECRIELKDKYMIIESTFPEKFDIAHTIFQTPGKIQRKKLIIWRTIRQLQCKLSVQIQSLEISSNEAGLEDLAILESYVQMKSSGNVTVAVKLIPGPSRILAEANVTFCKGIHPFRYKWLVNDEVISADGKLLIIEGLSPGKYVITCRVVSYNSTEILGQGWATTEILDQQNKVIIFPSKTIIGNQSRILLQAAPWGSKSSWRCRKGDGPCIDVEAFDMHSPVLSIPPGVLSPGCYFWNVENGEAQVCVKEKNLPVIEINVTSVFTASSENLVINGTVMNLDKGCQVWWRSVRQKGFDYINLFQVRTITNNETSNYQNIPLIIPSSAKALQAGSSYKFKLQVVCQLGQISYMEVPVIVNDPPRISLINVEPHSGEALITKFTVSRPEVEDAIEDYPLMYQWSYIDYCDTEMILAQGAFAREFTTFLPPGDLKLVVKICDVRGSCSKSLSSILTVIQAEEVPIRNFEVSLNQIQFLMSTGDTIEAFALATTIFKTLALTAEIEIREKAYKTIEEAIQERIKDLKNRTDTSLKLLKTCHDFHKQATAIVKYFRKGSKLPEILADFKTEISNKRLRRKDNSQ